MTSKSGSNELSSARKSPVLILAGFNTGILYFSANEPTAEDSSLSPRPRGCSGRVITATTRNWSGGLVSRISRMRAASCGVPMKTIFNVDASNADAGGGLTIGLALFKQFGQLAAI